MDVTEVFGITEVTTKDFLQAFRIVSQKCRGVVWRQVTLKDRVQEMQKPYRATIASTCFSAGHQPGHSQESPLWLKQGQGISTISLHDLLRLQKDVDIVDYPLVIKSMQKLQFPPVVVQLLNSQWANRKMVLCWRCFQYFPHYACLRSSSRWSLVPSRVGSGPLAGFKQNWIWKWGSPHHAVPRWQDNSVDYAR